MKKITLLLLVLFAFNSFSQDTTAFNLIGINSAGELDYFYNDSTSMGSLNIDSDFDDGFSIFQDPSTGVLYAILYNSNDTEGDRNLYFINPLTGSYSLVYDLVNNYANSADIGEDGIVYFSVGNGNTVLPNAIYKFDISNGLEILLSTPVMSGSRGLEYNPIDSSLYLFEGYESNFGDYTEKLYVYDLLTNTTDTLNTTGLYDEIHGAYYDEVSDLFFISAYGGEMYTTDNTYLNGTLYHDMSNGVTGNNVMDIERVQFIQGPKSRGYCSSDSVQINAYFSGVNYKWFNDGVEIAGAVDTFFYASSPGVYRALMEVTMNEQVNYIWSEEITVTQFTVPNVNISSAGNDTEICPGDTIVLTGASGGSLQWFLDGVAIVGANGSSYNATAAGAYNQMKTNTNGCSDTSAVAFVIVEDPNCTSGVQEKTTNVLQLYPNPTYGGVTVVNSLNTEVSFIVMDLTGKKVLSGSLKKGNNALDLNELNSGVYFITVNEVTKRIVKK